MTGDCVSGNGVSATGTHVSAVIPSLRVEGEEEVPFVLGGL